MTRPTMQADGMRREGESQSWLEFLEGGAQLDLPIKLDIYGPWEEDGVAGVRYVVRMI